MADDVVRIEDLPDYIEQVILHLRKGIAAARQAGVLCDMPEEVAFQVTVVKEWQALPMKGLETSVSNGESKREQEGKRTQEGDNTRTTTETSVNNGDDTSITERAGTTRNFTYSD